MGYAAAGAASRTCVSRAPTQNRTQDVLCKGSLARSMAADPLCDRNAQQLNHIFRNEMGASGVYNNRFEVA
jgi:hypothetical protein